MNLWVLLGGSWGVVVNPWVVLGGGHLGTHHPSNLLGSGVNPSAIFLGGHIPAPIPSWQRGEAA